VLIIDEAPLFREYLREKLVNNGVPATVGINGNDGMTKLRSLNPDLVILDFDLKRQGAQEFLKTKKASPSTAPIPVVVLATKIDQKKIIELTQYNVRKVFNKPVKPDALLATLSQLLGVRFLVDESPGIVEVHVNDDIVFVEAAMGLNRDKIELLGFKIIELGELYQIRVPKVIIMLSDIKLGYADGPNLQKLINVVMRSAKVRADHVRILTRDEFTRDFVEGQKEYNGIEVVQNLQDAVDGLLALSGDAETKAEIIGEKILSAETAEGEAMQLRYESDEKLTVDEMKETLSNLRIAIIDDDPVIQGIIANAFSKLGSRVVAYSDGADFFADANCVNFDLIFLDLMMPRMDGFAVMRELKDRGMETPVIVLSAVTRRDTVIRAFQMGVKSYLTKPLKPDDIFKKSLEILKVTF
jgi:DNA-binding response OmpR family regulator